jgi:hypothetical protein
MVRVVFFTYNYIQLQKKKILKHNPFLPWVLYNNPVFSTLKLMVIFLYPYIPDAFHNSISRLTIGSIHYHITDIFIRLCFYSSLVIITSLYKIVEWQYTTSTFNVFYNNISGIDRWIPFISFAQYAYNSENHHLYKLGSCYCK